MARCRSSSITAATVLMLVAVTTVCGAPLHNLNSADSHQSTNSVDSRPSTKALCHHRIVELPKVSFPNTSFNNAVVSLGVFLKHTKSDHTALFCRHIHFSQIFSDILSGDTRVFCAVHSLFFLSSHQLLYTSAPTFSCILLAKKIVFFSLHAHNRSP